MIKNTILKILALVVIGTLATGCFKTPRVLNAMNEKVSSLPSVRVTDAPVAPTASGVYLGIAGPFGASRIGELQLLVRQSPPPMPAGDPSTHETREF